MSKNGPEQWRGFPSRLPTQTLVKMMLARQDIRGIWVYRVEQWRERQADRYTGRLETCFGRIARRPRSVRSFSERYPQVRVTRGEHHYVFCVQPEGQKPLIIAVLHERMDMLARIGERLSR